MTKKTRYIYLLLSALVCMLSIFSNYYLPDLKWINWTATIFQFILIYIIVLARNEN